MLLNLHVKNMALIEEIEVDFMEHLNILTGETGAGKSIIIGSINAALGGRFSKEMVRDESKESLIELLFQLEDSKTMEQLKTMDINLSPDCQVLITRKMVNGRSVCKLNGETVTINKIKEIAGYLIDIHGQHEHQSLLHKSKHLDILDRFAASGIGSIKEEIAAVYESYRELKLQLEADETDEDKRGRELSFTIYELKEIEDANLKIGEDEDLHKEYKKIANSKSITQSLTLVHQLTGYEDDQSAGDSIGRGLKQMMMAQDMDEELIPLKDQLVILDSLLNDFNRDLSDYMQDMEFDKDAFDEIEARLDLINSLKAKYGNSIVKILEYKDSLLVKLDRLQDYENYRNNLQTKIEKYERELNVLCDKLTKIRKKSASKLTKLIQKALVELNFLEVTFDMEFKTLNDFTKNGKDEACFVISTNPGEKMRSIGEVASGGELSRIMLAVKSVLADQDAIETLIFDEIDVGISGRTAQKVSERLALIAQEHQVICITHLAQIAAMADTHYLIDKTVNNEKTITQIKPLDEDSSILELARITGGVQITQQVIKSAKEMKELAKGSKLY